MNIIFVVGYPRSGTTLLARLLQDYTGYLAVPETALYEEYIPSPFNNSPPKLQASLEKKLRLKSLTKDFSWINTIESGKANILLGVLGKFVDNSSLDPVGVIEKSPAHQHHVNQIKYDFPDSPIIYIIRHPAMSISSVRNTHWSGKYLFPQILEWKYRTRNSIKDIKAGRLEHIAYEDLVEHPDNIIEELLVRCGIKIAKSPVTGADLLVTPGEKGWKEKALLPPDPTRAAIRPDNLTPAQQETIQLCCAEEMKYFGYPTTKIAYRLRYITRLLLLYPFINRSLRHLYFSAGINKILGKPDLGSFP